MNRNLVALATVMFLLFAASLSLEATYSGPIAETVSAISSSGGHTHYPWPMFRHDPSHSGYTSSPGSRTNQTLWIYETTYDIFGPCPAVVDDVLYIGGGFGPILYALNASTGESIWNYTTWAWIASPPCVVDGVVYFGSFNTNVTALDAVTGSLLWNYTTGAWLAASAPCVVDDVVYIGGGYGNTVYALNATTGAKIWNYTAGDWVHSSPAVADGIVYVGSYDDNVYALNTTTGAKIWNYTTGFDVFSSPAVVDGVVYIGSNDNNVYALNAATGAKIWNYTTLGWVASSPAVVDGVVYVGSYDNNMYALNATTGAPIWSFPTGGAVSSSPAVADGMLYVGTGDPANRTYALNATTGAKIWSYKTGGDVWASPAVVDGVVYTASRDGKIYAIGYDPFPETSFTHSPVSPLVGETVTFNATDSYDPDGSIISYDWDFGDNTTGTGMIVTHNYTAFGVYEVTLTVTDDDGLTDTTWKTVKVGGFPVAKFTYSPEVPYVDETVTFNATDSYDPDGSIISYDWDFGDGTTGTGMIVDHTYTAAGTYTANLTVTDNDTLTDTTWKTVKVGPPAAIFAYSPESPTVNQTVTFDASASDPVGGSITNYDWDFGDGTTGTGMIVDHTYTAAGTYTAKLTVTDNDTLTDTTTRSITIAKLSSTISISASSTSVKADGNTTISGSITPKRVDATVTVHHRLSGDTAWDVLITVNTDSTGGYSYTWTPEEGGTYEVKASWQGDANTLGAESSIITVTVEKAAAPDYLVYALIAIVIIIVAALAVYFFKIRKS